MKRTRKPRVCAALLALTLLLAGCSAIPPSEAPEPETSAPTQTPEAAPPSVAAASAASEEPHTRRLEVDYNAREHAAEAAEANTGKAAPSEAEAQPADTEAQLTDTEPPEAAAGKEEASNEASAVSNGLVVVIDPGHQLTADLTQEPIGPGAA